MIDKSYYNSFSTVTVWHLHQIKSSPQRTSSLQRVILAALIYFLYSQPRSLSKNINNTARVSGLFFLFLGLCFNMFNWRKFHVSVKAIKILTIILQHNIITLIRAIHLNEFRFMRNLILQHNCLTLNVILLILKIYSQRESVFTK